MCTSDDLFGKKDILFDSKETDVRDDDDEQG